MGLRQGSVMDPFIERERERARERERERYHHQCSKSDVKKQGVVTSAFLSLRPKTSRQAGNQLAARPSFPLHPAPFLSL